MDRFLCFFDDYIWYLRTIEEPKKKACEDLETEQACSCSLFDDIDRLNKVLREKEDVVLQSGKLIEDLWVEKTELTRSYKKIERANTDLVGENMTLEEKIHGESLRPYDYFVFAVFIFYRLISYIDFCRA